jgi:hypothetical protein
MRIYKAVEEDKKLSVSDMEKVALLKLVENGQYIKNVGIRQDDYYILEIDDIDKEELGYDERETQKESQ